MQHQHHNTLNPSLSLSHGSSRMDKWEEKPVLVAPRATLVSVLHMWSHQLWVGRAPRWHPRSFPNVSVLTLSFQKLFLFNLVAKTCFVPPEASLGGFTQCFTTSNLSAANDAFYTSSVHAFFPKKLLFLSLGTRAKGSFEVSKCPETQRWEHLALNQKLRASQLSARGSAETKESKEEPSTSPNANCRSL